MPLRAVTLAVRPATPVVTGLVAVMVGVGHAAGHDRDRGAGRPRWRCSPR